MKDLNFMRNASAAYFSIQVGDLNEWFVSSRCWVGCFEMFCLVTCRKMLHEGTVPTVSTPWFTESSAEVWSSYNSRTAPLCLISPAVAERMLFLPPSAVVFRGICSSLLTLRAFQNICTWYTFEELLAHVDFSASVSSLFTSPLFHREAKKWGDRRETWWRAVCFY